MCATLKFCRQKIVADLADLLQSFQQFEKHRQLNNPDLISTPNQVRKEFGAALGRAVARFYKRYYAAADPETLYRKVQ